MENQNGFDLEQALRAWREDCASRPGISHDNARELESDLRERVAGLAKQGLNQKEAFTRAIGQLGSPAELAREFGRENPLAVWRERLFWIVSAAFGISVWSLLTDGPVLWFVNTFGVLLPLPQGALFSLVGSLPLLVLAMLLATGQLANVASRIRFFCCRHVAFAGGCLLAAGVVMRLFGPGHLTAPESRLVMAFGLSLWPFILLSLGISLFRPDDVSESGVSSLDRFPAAVWRERVFWMAVGTLAMGVWESVMRLGMRVLIGNIARPNLGGPALVGSFLLIGLTPLIVLGLLLRHRIRVGKDATAGNMVRSRAFFDFILVAECAWVGVQLASQYFWRPAGANISFLSNIVAHYFSSFQWLWPAGLGLLIIWLAPRAETYTNEKSPSLGRGKHAHRSRSYFVPIATR